MLDNNSLVTNRILVSGEGIHKTYEESFFKCLSSSEFARYFGNSVSGLFKNTNGEIEVSYCYGGYETAINNNLILEIIKPFCIHRTVNILMIFITNF